MDFKFLTIPAAILCLLALSPIARAADYQDWIPLLPESIDGLDKSGSPDGATMGHGGKSWTTVRQGYSDSSGDDIRLTIIAGDMAPQLQQFQSMKHFSMETDDRLVQSAQLSGYNSVVELNKARGKGTLLIQVQDNTLVVIEADAVESKAELISLADHVPLSDIAAL